MESNKRIDEQRQELDTLISQAERRLMVQVDPYIVSRRGVDFGEYFYDLRSRLTSKIFSEESLANTEATRGLNQNVEDIIRENYEEILKQTILNVRGDSIGEVKHYVGHSYNDMLGQVQSLMQNIRAIMSSKSDIQNADGARLLQEADRLIAQIDKDMAGHRVNLENLWTQVKAMEKAHEEKQQEEEQANPASILDSVDQLIASTDEFIATHNNNLAELKNQLSEYVQRQQVQEAGSKKSETVQSDVFRLSDDDMEKFNKGVQEVMQAINEGTSDRKPRVDDLLK